ncbi:Maff2 family mobile element protein [Peptoniphilus genitalis]
MVKKYSTNTGVLKTLVTAIGAGLGAWGVINLMEGYGNDNPGAKSQGIKQFMAK